jgi:hypothetical protein
MRMGRMRMIRRLLIYRRYPSRGIITMFTLPYHHSLIAPSPTSTANMAALAFPKFTMSHDGRENELVNVILKRWAAALSGQPTVEVLPPGIDVDTWKVVLSKFLEILGEKGVILGDEHKLNYLDIFSLAENEHEVRGSPCALRPTTVEQIQGILRVANEYKIPVWTVSRGRNLGYGANAGRIRACHYCLHQFFLY